MKIEQYIHVREKWTRFTPKDGKPLTDGFDVLNAAMLK